MINFDARNLSIFSSGDTVTSYASSHRAHEILSRFFEFSLEEITPIIICTSPLGAPCVHRWKLAPGWNAVNAWNRQPAIYQAFFLFSLFSFFFKLREQWQPRLFIADEYALAAVKPRHRVWNSSRLFVDLFSKTGEKTEMVGSLVFVANKCTGHGCREAMPSSAFHRVTDAPECRCIDSGCRNRLRGASRWPWFRIIC